MTFQQELKSWFTPENQPTVAATIKVGDHAPKTDKLWDGDGSNKSVILTFLRHCGCPFAEKSFRQFRDLASLHSNIRFVAVSQSEAEHTDEWLKSVGGDGDGAVKVITDPGREVFAQWGLGIAGWGSILSPTGIADTVSLAWNEGIKNRPTRSGNRWQTAGSFAVDGDRVVKWAHISDGAGDISKFEEGLKALGQ